MSLTLGDDACAFVLLICLATRKIRQGKKNKNKIECWNSKWQVGVSVAKGGWGRGGGAYSILRESVCWGRIDGIELNFRRVSNE